MSPFGVRRYRAERLLRDEFERLREKVIRGVSRRLAAAGVRLDASDLEACYSQAWQGLYATVLGGTQIDDPSAWLALVTYRRAIDEHRSRKAIGWQPFDDRRAQGGASDRAISPLSAEQAQACDLAAELDDRARVRQLFEALRVRLSEREQQAATLCYLQGLSRADAAARMGVSRSRMRKLMEGRGAGSPGVAAKVGALVQTIGAGNWCEEQGSLMRGLAYGILDPEGERYRLALLHRDGCPACRAYVLSLRGLAAVLPPAPLLLHWALGVAASTGAAGTGAGGAASAGSAAGTGGVGSAAAGAGAAPAGSGLAGGALSASGVAGVGAAGGGWWLAAGPFGAKLAVGCLLALGVGAGCVALEGGSARGGAFAHRQHVARESRSGRDRADGGGAAVGLSAIGDRRSSGSATGPAAGSQTATATAAARKASREFGPEQAAANGASRAAGGSGGPTASASSVGQPAAGAQRSTAAPASSTYASGGAATASGAAAAQREFSPG